MIVTGFGLLVLTAAVVSWEWWQIRTRACDGCRLEKLGESHQSVPHTCPFARYRHAIVRTGDTIYEFGEESVSRRRVTINRAVKGEKRSERIHREFSDRITRDRERRTDERRIHREAESEVGRRIEAEVESRKQEARRRRQSKEGGSGSEGEGEGSIQAAGRNYPQGQSPVEIGSETEARQGKVQGDSDGKGEGKNAQIHRFVSREDFR